MARRLARDRLIPTRRRPLADRLPPAARTRRQDATERDAALEIHRTACLALAHFDTSWPAMDFTNRSVGRLFDSN
jgi:hypothetical protein